MQRQASLLKKSFFVQILNNETSWLISKLLSKNSCRYSFTWHCVYWTHFLPHALNFLYTERGEARGKNEEQEAHDDDDDVIKNYVIVPLLP